jgi:5-methyltetrahydropteroyltriglutamate--homocysteine methyltransferase
MQASKNRIFTTLTGSLPKNKQLARQQATPDQILAAVKQAVRLQVAAREPLRGIDVIADGEQSKQAFNFYVLARLTGFGDAQPSTWEPRDLTDHPVLAERFRAVASGMPIPACVSPITLRDPQAVHRDIANLQEALDGEPYEEAFLTAASPGILASSIPNRYYRSHEEYLGALADVMAHEYRAITDAGLLLQVDAPELALDRQLHFADEPMVAFRRHVGLAIEALNSALAGIPTDRIRVHVCHGNYLGTHHRDVFIGKVLDLLMKIRCGGLSIVAANGQHRETTYQAIKWWVDSKRWPDDKILIPGCVDSLTVTEEHPETIAATIIRYADLVGREHVMAGTDCGFGTIGGYNDWIPPTAVRSRLGALAAGAELASARLWRKARVA